MFERTKIFNSEFSSSLEKMRSDVNFKDPYLSFSEYSIFSSCPRRWYLEYVQKRKVFKHNMYTVFGTAIHSTIQSFLELYFFNSNAAFDFNKHFAGELKSEYLGAVEKNNDEHFSDRTEYLQFLNDGLWVLDAFKKECNRFFDKDVYDLLAIEAPVFSKTNNNLNFYGLIDLLLLNKVTSQIVCVDIKTANKPWSKYKKKSPEVKNQLAFYNFFLGQELNIEPTKMNSHYLILDRLTFGIENFSVEYGPRQKNRISKIFSNFLNETRLAGEIKEESEFPAQSGKNGWNCTFCPFKDNDDLCPREKRS